MPSESILSVVRYSDPGFAAEWLCRAFGFAVHRSTDRLEGGLAYVVLRCGDDLVLIASSGDDDLIVEPGEVSKRSTQAYFIPRKRSMRIVRRPCRLARRSRSLPATRMVGVITFAAILEGISGSSGNHRRA